MSDFYATLGVEKTATTAEVKAAYRNLALKYHPDRNKEPGAEDKFKEVTAAYEVLSNEGKRKEYDSPFGPGLGFPPGFGFGGVRRDVPMRGRSVGLRADLSIYEAIVGAKRTMEYSIRHRCVECSRTCKSCGGKGVVVNVNGHVMMSSTCRVCGGDGNEVGGVPCEKCAGAGFYEKKMTAVIDFPPGTETGQRFGVDSGGYPGTHGGPPGALVVETVISIPKAADFSEEDLASLERIFSA